MLHVPKTLELRTERVLSTVALAVLLGGWLAVYATVCPNEGHPVRLHIVRAEAAR